MKEKNNLPRDVTDRLTEYLERARELETREPQHIEEILTPEEYTRISDYILYGKGEAPEYIDHFAVSATLDPKTGKTKKTFIDAEWEKWNAERAALANEYHDDIIEAMRFFARYIEDGKTKREEPVDVIITTVLDAAVKALQTSKIADEVRDALPQLSSIIPQKHVIPNNKLANTLTSDDLIGKGDIELIVSGRGKSDIITRCILNYEGDNVTLSSRQPFTEYDRNVADAVTSLYEYGDPSHVITPATVYRAMIHATGTETPSPQTLGAVTKSLDKMRFVRVQIDCTEELKRRKVDLNGTQVVAGKIDTYLLNLEKVEIMAGGQKVIAYKIIKAPILYDYAKITKQVLTVPAELLAVPNASNNEQRIAIKGYLLRRVSVMKGKTAQSRRILFNNIYNAAGKPDATNTEKNRLRDYAFTVLDFWKTEKFIKGYAKVKEGKTIFAVDIQL